jgi:hypothetical protein
VPESEQKPLRLWIDPARLPRPKTYFAPPEKSAEDYLMNRYLELADLVLKGRIEKDKKKP